MTVEYAFDIYQYHYGFMLLRVKCWSCSGQVNHRNWNFYICIFIFDLFL